MLGSAAVYQRSIPRPAALEADVLKLKYVSQMHFACFCAARDYAGCIAVTCAYMWLLAAPLMPSSLPKDSSRRGTSAPCAFPTSTHIPIIQPNSGCCRAGCWPLADRTQHVALACAVPLCGSTADVVTALRSAAANLQQQPAVTRRVQWYWDCVG